MTGAAEGVVVKICGRNYSIVADVKNEVTRQIANMVDEKIRELQETANIRDDLKAAVLSAMNIAGELYEYKEKLQQMEIELSAITDRTRILSDRIANSSRL